jgi:hypothetical protein
VVDYIRHERDVTGIEWDSVNVTVEVKLPCLQAVQKLKGAISTAYPKAKYPIENLVQE